MKAKRIDDFCIEDGCENVLLENYSAVGRYYAVEVEGTKYIADMGAMTDGLPDEEPEPGREDLPQRIYQSIITDPEQDRVYARLVTDEAIKLKVYMQLNKDDEDIFANLE